MFCVVLTNNNIYFFFVKILFKKYVIREFRFGEKVGNVLQLDLNLNCIKRKKLQFLNILL